MCINVQSNIVKTEHTNITNLQTFILETRKKTGTIWSDESLILKFRENETGLGAKKNKPKKTVVRLVSKLHGHCRTQHLRPNNPCGHLFKRM